LNAQAGAGIVYLVGAGPGDPGLITVKGRRLLELADVVVYDYLANPKLLSYCPQAKVIYVGKKAAAHTFTQEQINQLLIDQASPGKRVVRLKGGDPFIFGRGGEECEALHRAGIRFEVVPGITASIGGTCYAGIPVTHRDFNSSFTVITGHEKEEEYKDPDSRGREAAAGSSDIDWNVVAKLPCMAFYMGVKALPRISTNLIEHGMNPQTPAATIQWGTMPRQRVVTGTISDIVQRVTEAGITAPAITIVGKVVTLRPIMSWFENRPLFGQTIVVTRTRQQVSDLSLKLEEMGANVIEAPTIELVEPNDWTEVDQAMTRSGQYDWIVFTSANGVRFTRDRLRTLDRDVRVFGTAKIAAIGDATPAAIRENLSLHVDLCPESFVAEALADALAERGQVAGKRFLLLRADIARPILRERLQNGGAAEVRDVAIYQTQPAKSLPAELTDALSQGGVQWITFTSSSTVKNFVALLGSDYARQLQNVKLASIGPITTQTMTELGLQPTVQADTFNVEGLVEAISAAPKAH
jgi:uroporphyrinogen III methyltransferase/synthase